MLKDFSKLPLKKRPIKNTQNKETIPKEGKDLTISAPFTNESNSSLKLSNDYNHLKLYATKYKEQKLAKVEHLQEMRAPIIVRPNTIRQLTSADFNNLNTTLLPNGLTSSLQTSQILEKEQNNSQSILNPSPAVDEKKLEKDPLKCDVYKKEYISRDSSIKDKTNHTIPIRTLNCPYNNSFQPITPPPEKTTPEDLSLLSSESSETIKPYKRRYDNAQRYNCNPCGNSYSTYFGLTKHQQYHCPGNKSFNCNPCKRNYTSLKALQRHIRTHKRPYKCHMCGKAFSDPFLLQRHIRTHTGEKPFSCQHCNRAFADRCNLRAHLQTHSDVKKYSGPTCSKTFSRKSYLKEHNDKGCPENGPQIQSYPTFS